MGETVDFDDLVGKRLLVEFDRKPFSKQKLRGFVIDWNYDFVLMEVYDPDWAETDGFCVLNYTSIRHVGQFPAPSFADDVFKLKNIVPSPRPPVDLLNGWPEVLRSVNYAFGLTGIELELRDKNCLDIGRVTKIGRKKFRMLEIDAEANWKEKETKYRLKDLTLVSFGIRYMLTLQMVSKHRHKTAAEEPE